LIDASEAMGEHAAGSLQAGRKLVLAHFVRPGMEIAEGDTVKKYLLQAARRGARRR
jgi:hypothetical protein